MTAPAPSPRTADGRPAPLCTAAGDEHTLTAPHGEEVDAVADVLAEAFAGYPWTDWLVPEDDRPARLRALHRADLAHVGLPLGVVRVARCPGSERPVGAIVALRPDQPIPAEAWSAVREVEADLLGPRRQAADEADALLSGLRPVEPAVVVATMGVARDHRRRGVARRLLAEATRLADGLRVAAYLETSTTANVALYTAAGFVTTGHLVLPDGGPEVWAMRRDARP